jgi:hypothetical protein
MSAAGVERTNGVATLGTADGHPLTSLGELKNDNKIFDHFQVIMACINKYALRQALRDSKAFR